MRLAQLLLLIGVVGLVACMAPAVRAESVPVGSSSLIATLDYSDTYTITSQGGLQDRPDGAFGLAGIDSPTNGVVGEGQWIENAYGNTPRKWTDGIWSINTDTSVILGDAKSPYPGNSGGGSATGLTQFGGWGDWGIEYGLRDRYVVQFDSVQSWDRIDIGTGPVRDTLGGGNFTVFFRPSTTAWLDVGLYHGSHGEYDTGLQSPTTAYAWHNYAALFDITERTIEVFVDENSLGVIDIDAVGGGALAAEPFTNDAVNVGVCHSAPEGGWINWSDNFQVGAPVPEPGIVALCVTAVASLFLSRRRGKV